MGKNPLSSNIFTDFFKLYICNKRIWIVALLGFSSGLPLFLTLSTLSWWLAKYGLKKSEIGLFAYVGTPYAFKFLWSPLVDRLSIPYLTAKFGRRRSWMILSQILLAIFITMMGFSQPDLNLTYMAICATLVAFWSATQDIVIDAYRIDVLKSSEIAAGASIEVNGYRIGMLVAGAGAMSLSDSYSWSIVYGIMATCMLVGIITALIAPNTDKLDDDHLSLQTTGYKEWLFKAVVEPLLDYIKKPGWWAALLFIVLYKISDNLIAGMANVFYNDIGFTGAEIGVATKLFGLPMTILGSFIVGLFAYRIGLLKALFISGIIHTLSNGMFLVLAEVGNSLPVLYTAVAVENISNGMMIGAFVGFLSSLCSVQFSATQYALLSSFMALTRVFFSGISGFVAEYAHQWTKFFTITLIAAIPSLLFLLFMMKKFPNMAMRNNNTSKIE